VHAEKGAGRQMLYLHDRPSVHDSGPRAERTAADVVRTDGPPARARPAAEHRPGAETEATPLPSLSLSWRQPPRFPSARPARPRFRSGSPR
jgi:hypothetical protein